MSRPRIIITVFLVIALVFATYKQLGLGERHAAYVPPTMTATPEVSLISQPDVVADRLAEFVDCQYAQQGDCRPAFKAISDATGAFGGALPAECLRDSSFQGAYLDAITAWSIAYVNALHGGSVTIAITTARNLVTMETRMVEECI